MTKAGNRCPNDTGLVKDGKHLCHTHHPDMTRQLQIAADRQAREARIAAMKARQPVRRAPTDPVDTTLTITSRVLKDGAVLYTMRYGGE